MDFYATFSLGQIRDYIPADTCCLFPASSWASRLRKDGNLPSITNLPDHLTNLAADCGGFVASRIWGEYRYSPAQYVNWLQRWRTKSGQPRSPKWAATMDYCCENPITGGDQCVVADRQFKTTLNAWLFWNEYRDASWAWVPTIQGWDVEDYVRHAQEMKPLIARMALHYKDNSDWRVGIGTLCNRADSAMVLKVVMAVAQELPGVKFHLWGVKLNVLKSHVHLPGVVSVDSAAWIPGGMGRSGWEAQEKRKELGMMQHEYFVKECLPAYQRKFQAAISQPKQLTLVMAG